MDRCDAPVYYTPLLRGSCKERKKVHLPVFKCPFMKAKPCLHCTQLLIKTIILLTRPTVVVTNVVRRRCVRKCKISFLFPALITLNACGFPASSYFLLAATRNYRYGSLNLLALELFFFLILAQPVYKMWIIQGPNTLELWNKMHFEEKKLRIYTTFKIFSTYICWINTWNAYLEVRGAVYVYGSLGVKGLTTGIRSDFVVRTS